MAIKCLNAFFFFLEYSAELLSKLQIRSSESPVIRFDDERKAATADGSEKLTGIDSLSFKAVVEKEAFSEEVAVAEAETDGSADVEDEIEAVEIDVVLAAEAAFFLHLDQILDAAE